MNAPPLRPKLVFPGRSGELYVRTAERGRGVVLLVAPKGRPAEALTLEPSAFRQFLRQGARMLEGLREVVA